MLQQILQDLYVDPEILAELDEEQKQILFVKMRAEQVRRWNEREDDFEKQLKIKPKPPRDPESKRVDFLKGADGCEWVWVMGEHKNDCTVDELLEAEAQQTARKQAEEEAQELRQKEELSKVNDTAREELAKISKLRENFEQKEQQRLQELNAEESRVLRKSKQVYDSEKKRRSTEIYVQWKAQRIEIEKEAEQDSKAVEESWKVLEDKAKEAEKEMQNVARRARIDYRESIKRASQVLQVVNVFNKSTAAASSHSSSKSKPPVPPKRINSQATVAGSKGKPRPLRPRNRNMVIDWFMKEERGKGSGQDPTTNKIATWFHGLISRAEAETLLAEKGKGAFLVRVSERVWGYTISYQEKQRCKHFLIDTTDEGYQFIGADQIVHKSLAELVSFHKETPITITGQERLMYPVGQSSDPPDYWELFHGNKTESTTL